MSKFALCAVFEHEENGTEAFTYYETRLFDTLQEAEEAIAGEWGETIAEDATIDSANASPELNPDLQGFYFSDVQAYEVSQRPYAWSELAELNHAEQVLRFGFCTCEDNEGNPNPFDDCPKGGE